MKNTCSFYTGFQVLKLQKNDTMILYTFKGITLYRTLVLFTFFSLEIEFEKYAGV